MYQSPHRPPLRKSLARACLAVVAAVAGIWSVPAAAQADIGSTYHQIVNKNDSQCLVVLAGATQHAAPVGVAGCSGAAHELWDLQAVGNGLYYIKVRHTGMCLNVAYYGQADPSPVVQATCSGGTNEQWEVRPSENDWNWLVARHSGKCLDKTGNTVVQWSCHHTWATWQQWRIADTGIPTD
jgi:hypothetical protein